MRTFAIMTCALLWVLPAHAAPSASRATGVAPLSIHFTADLVASSPGNMPFHDYEYAWDFGDPTSGTWGTSGKPKNTDKGPVASHVYETSGVFTATLTVRNSSGIIDTETFSITVQDPDLVFSGTKTTCISTTSNFTGCPAGASQVTTSDLSGIGAYTDAGERVLLRRGDSWALTVTPSYPNNAGPVHIGAYGTCSNPDALGICSNAPVVSLTGDTNVRFAHLANKQDWRLSDIAIASPASSTSPIPIIGGTAMKRDLVLRVKTTGGSSALLADTLREVESDYMDENAIVSCKFTDFGGTGVFVGSERLVLLGNIIQNSPETHVLRVWQAYQSVISHNILSGASLTNPSGRHALKLHGPSPLGAVGQTFVGDYADVGKSGLRNFTQFVVIANNVFGGNGASWPVSIGPQNVTYDERLSDILFEKNRGLSDYGPPAVNAPDCGINVAGRYVTIRNNVFDGTGGDSTYRGVAIETRLTNKATWPTLGNRVYNNTVYSSKVHTSGAYGVQVDDTASDTIIKNNYVSFPDTINKDMIRDNSGSVVASNNTMADTPYFIDPNNTSPLSRNFALQASSSAIGQGASVPVFDDFAGSPRYGAMDIGAFRATPRRLFRNFHPRTEVEP